jgi:catalase (peroxidase I)
MNRDFPLAPSPNLEDRKNLRAAKQVAKAQAKVEFKKGVLEAKQNEVDMPKYMVRDIIRDERKNYKEAKKEIRKYKDY